MKSKLLSNITPGEILEQEFLRPMAITQYRLAKDMGVSPRRINEIVKGQRAITADTALRLGRYFRMSPEFWLNLQSHYDLEQAQQRFKGPDGRERVKCYRSDTKLETGREDTGKSPSELAKKKMSFKAPGWRAWGARLLRGA